MRSSSLPLGSQQPTIAENIITAIAVVRANSTHIRHAIGGIALVFGLLFCSGAEESLSQAFIALVFIIVAATLFDTFEKKGGAA